MPLAKTSKESALQKHGGKRMRRWLWVLTALAALLCFWQMGSVPLFDTDEPRYAQAAREMMERGDWVLPTFNGQPRYAKPVLFYWLLIAAYRLFGVNEFAARFWSGVAALGIACLLGAMMRQAFGVDAALLSALIWLTMVGTQFFAHAAITDMVLTFFMTAAIFTLWQAVTTGDGRWLWVGAMAMGLAVLTKGPVGFLLPSSVVAIAAAILSRHAPHALRFPKPSAWLMSLFLFAAIVSPWYVAVTIRTQGEFLRQFLFAENLQRYAGGSKLPIWWHLAYYPVTLFLMALPWSALAICQGLKGKGTGDERQWRLLWRLWALLPVVLFTFSRTKNPQYVLLSTPAVAALTVEWVAAASPPQERCGKGFFAVTMVLLAFSLALTPFLFNAVTDWRMRLAGNEPVQLGWGIIVMAMLALLSVELIAFPRFRFALFVSALFCLWHAIAFASLVPTIGAYRQAPLKHFAQQSARQLQGDDFLVVYRRDLSSVVFYSHRQVIRIDDRRRLVDLLKTSHRVDVLTHVRFLPELQGLPLHRVERVHGFVWLSNRLTRCLVHSR
jgi:4-amino-4-deoxy-L-arabinose transferase-like glycosyltransferase